MAPTPRVEFPESRIQLAVGILIVKNRYGVCPQRDAGESQDALSEIGEAVR